MIFETFAYRNRRSQQGELPDVYTYDNISEQLRHQICVALYEGIGIFHFYTGYEMQSVAEANEAWKMIDRVCHKELFSYLKFTSNSRLDTRYLNYLMNVSQIDDFLSAVEIGCRALEFYRGESPEGRGAEEKAEDSIDEINQRFEQHAVGYQFESGQIIRVDSKAAHAEIVRPALRLLTVPIFVKANEEFLSAHKHYREGSFKDCVTAANRAFESTLKAICDTELWTYDKGDRASELVTKVTSNGLFTHAFDKGMSAYVAMLKTGLPSVRNDAGAHGDGIAAAAVTAEIARFAINLTASNILFVGESYTLIKAQ